MNRSVLEKVRALPSWAFSVALFVTLAASGSFGTLATLDLFAQMTGARIPLAAQIPIVLAAGAVSMGVYELLDRGARIILWNFSRGGLVCERGRFLKDLRACQILRFLLATPGAIISFFYPLGLLIVSAVNMALTLGCYVAFYLILERDSILPQARARVLLLILAPVLLHLLLTGVAL